MGYHTNDKREQDLYEAPYGPVVGATPGYYLLDGKQPDREPQPVIGWRIGRSWTLPVTILGCKAGEYFVIQPDGRVARCFEVYGVAVPMFWESVSAWKLWLDGKGNSLETLQTKGEDPGITNVVQFYHARHI